MNFILEGKIKQTVMYTYSTIMNFILEGKLCFTETKRLCRITLQQKKGIDLLCIHSAAICLCSLGQKEFFPVPNSPWLYPSPI